MAAEGPAAAASVHELETLRESERQLELKLAQQRRREGELILRLAIRERELREARDSLRRAAAKPEHKQLESLMLDPAVNLEVLKLREQVKEGLRREQELREELEATQFQSGSIAGKKLVQKCKELQEENEQLGREVTEGRMQALRAEAAMHREHASELRNSLGETREWVESLMEELETAQATIFSLRREVSQAKQANRSKG